MPLAREIEILQLYLRVMEARFEHRLRVSIQLEDELKSALVPQLILQPLVENAIRHGMDPVTFQVEIAIAARRIEQTMVLTVRDRGPGIQTAIASSSGIGLRNTRDRLERLYGREQTFGIANASDGGAIVSLVLPL